MEWTQASYSPAAWTTRPMVAVRLCLLCLGTMIVSASPAENENKDIQQMWPLWRERERERGRVGGGREKERGRDGRREEGGGRERDQRALCGRSL